MNHLIPLFHGTPLVYLCPSRKPEEFDLLSHWFVNTQTYDQTNNIFNDDFLETSNDYHVHSYIDLMKPQIFEDIPFEGSEFCQENEALQLLPMVMSSLHVLEKIHEQAQIRLSKIKVSKLESSHILVAPNGGPYLEKISGSLS